MRRSQWAFEISLSVSTLVLFILLGVEVATALDLQLVANTGSEERYDVVIRNGRVMDPETKFDRPGYNVGIRGKEIVAITTKPIDGRAEIDAEGRVVAPGFIDAMSYDPNSYGVWYKIADGVTTNLALHGGTTDAASWYRRFEKERVPVNFGVGFFYNGARLKLAIDSHSPASSAKIEQLSKMAEMALSQGALGIGMSIEYMPGISNDEIKAMMRIAKRFNAPVFFHVRYSSMEPPGTNIEALNEIIHAAATSGATVHISHITSTGGTFSMNESLNILSAAHDSGVSITACAYPYAYWASYLNSARFDKGWQKRFRITYRDLQIGGSDERLTENSFSKYRNLGKLAVAYAIPEEDVVNGLRSPLVMIGSDGIIEPGNNNHPRSAGAFTRTLAVYVRELRVLTLMDALGKMTIMQAKLLESRVPAFRRKGRLQPGADADIVIFDPEKVNDRATVEQPNRYADGIEYLLVNGKIVKDKRGLKKNVRAGEAIRATPMRKDSTVE